MSLGTFLKSAEAEVELLFHKLVPPSIKPIEDELIHIGSEIKAFLVSPEGTTIEAFLLQLFPGTWEASTISVIEKAIGIAIPTLINIESNSDGTIANLVEKFIAYLKTISPKLQNSGVLKLLSSLFQAIDPSLSEVEADTSAQLLYAKTKV